MRGGRKAKRTCDLVHLAARYHVTVTSIIIFQDSKLGGVERSKPRTRKSGTRHAAIHMHRCGVVCPSCDGGSGLLGVMQSCLPRTCCRDLGSLETHPWSLPGKNSVDGYHRMQHDSRRLVFPPVLERLIITAAVRCSERGALAVPERNGT